MHQLLYTRLSITVNSLLWCFFSSVTAVATKTASAVYCCSAHITVFYTHSVTLPPHYLSSVTVACTVFNMAERSVRGSARVSAAQASAATAPRSIHIVIPSSTVTSVSFNLSATASSGDIAHSGEQKEHTREITVELPTNLRALHMPGWMLYEMEHLFVFVKHELDSDPSIAPMWYCCWGTMLSALRIANCRRCAVG